MSKRGRLEIIRDILSIIQLNKNNMKVTPLIRKSNLSSSNFKEYYSELLKKEFIKETSNLKNKSISLTNKGQRFLEEYKNIVSFIEEFEL